MTTKEYKEKLIELTKEYNESMGCDVEKTLIYHHKEGLIGCDGWSRSWYTVDIEL